MSFTPQQAQEMQDRTGAAIRNSRLRPATGTAIAAPRMPASDVLTTRAVETQETLKTHSRGLELVITGQIFGGKNNIIVTRSGHRFPKKSWATWRDKAVAEVRKQLPANFVAISSNVNVSLEYVAGDKRRRDMPAIVDSIWHVLEKAGVVIDDTQLWISESSRSYDKANAKAKIKFYMA